MFIICNEYQADKKVLKKLDKIVISEALEGVKDSNKISHMNQLLPPMELFHNFINGDISQKKFTKKFMNNIRENDQLYASITLIMLIYKKQKDIVLICSAEEMKYGYMQAICTLLSEDFGIQAMDYNTWKKYGAKLGKGKFDEKALKRASKEYSEILFEDDDDYSSKKKKKSKKNNKKNSKKSKGKDKKKNKKNDKFEGMSFGHIASKETIKREKAVKRREYEDDMESLGFCKDDAPIVVTIRRVR